MLAPGEFWRERLHVPTYRVVDAARYAGTSPQTVNNWQRLREDGRNALSKRDPGQLLTYLQLIELGVVAAMRKAGVKLKVIRKARDYLADRFASQFPFAEYRFKTDGKQLLVDSEELDKADRNKLVVVSENGQYAWKEIIQHVLREFEYPPEDEGPVVRWKVAGVNEPIIIDPRVSFGSPNVDGIATWVLRERYQSGESINDIAGDFDLSGTAIMAALRFEGIPIELDRPSQWRN